LQPNESAITGRRRRRLRWAASVRSWPRRAFLPDPAARVGICLVISLAFILWRMWDLIWNGRRLVLHGSAPHWRPKTRRMS